ncbi:MAG: tetratricopeptide repeat protein, partial [Kiritimatiellaeota bacterium]|nr:tetratricopeptide repeat protein [Kiritimatiellota bacterium]
RDRLRMTQAIIAIGEGQNAQAKIILQGLVDEDSKNVMALAFFAEFLTVERDEEGLARVLRRLELAAGPDDYHVLMAYAGQAMLKSSLESARNNVGVAKDSLESARNYYERASQKQTGNIVLLERLLELDFRLADKESAQGHAVRILRLDRNHSGANYIMGSLTLAKDIDAAIDYLTLSVASRPSVANLNDLAVAHLMKNNLDMARHYAQEGLELGEDSYNLWDTYGQILVAEGKYDEAEKAFDKALRIESSDPRVRIHLAEACDKKGDTERAREIVGALALDAENLPRDERALFDELYLKLHGKSLR